MRVQVENSLAGERLDQALCHFFPDLSRARLQKYIREGHCRLDNAPALSPSSRLKPGQIIEFEAPQIQNGLVPEYGALNILYEDNDIAVISKSPGLTTHPCTSCPEGTLAHRLLAHFPRLKQQEGDRPGIVHRLDKDTSGVMVIALSEKARQKLIEDFGQRRVKKEYLALVAGSAPEKGECREPIGRHPSLKTRMAVTGISHGGKPAHTEWIKLWEAPDKSCSLLKIRIHTGRTHQIRVHMAFLGHPLLGDKIYAPEKIAAMGDRQMLHSWKLGLYHPESGEQLKFIAPLPEDFHNCMEKYAISMLKIVVTGNQGCGKSAFCQDLAKAGMKTISADAIVAKLYSKPGAVSDWLKFHKLQEVLTKNGAVDKAQLLDALEKIPGLREDFEKYIHALVLDEIESFWKEAEQKGEKMALAEVPLYFESGAPERFNHEPYVIGVSCPQPVRWRRIMENRGWPEKKVATIESWQIPEQKKLSLCDIVVNNSGTREMLAENANRIYAELAEKTRANPLPKTLNSI